MRADIRVMLELTTDEAKLLRDACGRAAYDSTDAEAQKRLEELFFLFDRELRKEKADGNRGTTESKAEVSGEG